MKCEDNRVMNVPDRTGETCVISESSIYLWHESQKEFGAQFTVIISVTVNAPSLSPTGGVKSTSPVAENHYKNGYVNYNIYKNFIKTNEDNYHDTKYTIHNDTNGHDARKLHKGSTAARVSRPSCLSDDVS